MQQSKLQYILTWLALSIMLICITLLMIHAWNSRIIQRFSPSVILLLWILASASGIYLFMLAVKKAHRQYVDEKRDLEKEKIEKGEEPINSKDSTKEKKNLDVAATSRKLVRRIPDKAKLEELGPLLLKNLSRELEIMSGVFYLEKKGSYESLSTFAMVSSTEPYSFKEGEGLTGQVARNQQVLLLTRLPEAYLEVYSGLGKAAPSNLAIVPLVHKGRTLAVIEISGYRYEAGEIENMFRIFARDLMDKLSINLD